MMKRIIRYSFKLALAIGIASLLIPGIPAVGAVIRAANAVDNVVDAAKAIDNVVDTVNAVDNAVDGAKAVDKAVDTTKALQDIATKAKDEILAMGDDALTKAQKAASEKYPNLKKAYVGSAIDKRFKSLASEAFPDLEFSKLFQKAPDVRNLKTGQWWDLTTEASWPAHLDRYEELFGPNGLPLYW